jgi:hypothetical protein
MSEMARDEFIKDWLKRSRSTREDMETIGLIALPCNCGDRRCPGWRMTNVRHLLDDEVDALPAPYRDEARRLKLKLLGRED